MRPGDARKLGRLLPVDRWPSPEEGAALRWFSPGKLGPAVARRRTWVPAMVPWRATESGEVTPDVLGWYGRFAEGKPGVIVVEATGVRDVPSGPLLRIGDDRFVPGLRDLVHTVRERSEGETLLLIQLIDFLRIRRRPNRNEFLGRHLRLDRDLRARLGERSGDPAIRDLPEDVFREHLMTLHDDALEAILSDRDLESLRRGYRERVTDVHLDHIRDLPQTLPRQFAEAACRARDAGFDGVELHYAHAYTMASFLSRLNTRQDGYGSDRNGRLRLPLEVFRAVRTGVGHDFVVGARFLGDEVIAGGSDVDDAAFFGETFAREGFDFLSVSKGGKFEDAKEPKEGQAVYPYTGRSGHECMPTVKIGDGGPFGRNVPLAARIRSRVRAAGYATPVVASGGIASPWQAEEILARGEADFVAAARQTLCDPDWFEKVRLGQGDAVRRCFFTNYCEALDQSHKEVTCQRWDREWTEDQSVSLAKDGRRRLLAPPWKPPPGMC
ncbi:MAG: NADH:flavin oxidoreductase [Myxococcales bacterium]|nr:NADH:flavin oxidoreductase [Myxococcales bacterium]